METIQQISLQNLTKLPLKELVKSDGIGQTIIIKTPHKGTVTIDYKEKTGFFQTTPTDKIFSKIARDIQKLEEESKEYLLQEWLKANPQA